MSHQLRVASGSRSQYASHWLAARAPVRLGQGNQAAPGRLLVGAVALVVALSVWYAGRRRLLQRQVG